jgi:two-component system, sporulation sensor kinase E
VKAKKQTWNKSKTCHCQIDTGRDSIALAKCDYSAEYVESDRGACRSLDVNQEMEEHWHLSEARYSYAVSNQEQLVCRIKPDSTIIFVNEAFCRYFGGIASDYKGLSFLTIAAEIDRQGIKDALQSCQAGNAGGVYPWRMMGVQGQLTLMQWSMQTLYNNRGMLVELELAGRGTHWKMHEAMRESELCYRTIFETTAMAMIIYDEDSIITRANSEFEKLSGYSKTETEGIKLWTEFVDDEEPSFIKRYDHLREFNLEGVPARFEGHFRDRYGRVKDVLVTVAFIPMNRNRVASIVDITERKQMEQELLCLDKLNLVGEIAASIGHEVRNPMTSIRGFLQMMSENEKYAAEREYFDLMIEEIDRVNMIITEFLLMARDKQVDLKPQSLNLILKNISPLICADARSQDKNVQLELGDIPLLMLDIQEIRQMVFNLARNGLESMNSGGTLTVRTRQKGEQVLLEVIDRGQGIPPEIRERIGVPFFTTKDNGTGLGLSICYSIAARHQAILKVYSSSQGTCITVFFNLQA